MTGLEKITNRILEDAGRQAGEIRAAAEAEAEEILRETRDSLEKMREEADESLQLEQKNRRARAESSAALKKRQMLLAAKQEMISGLIEKARETLLNMEDREYFALIEKMAECFLLSGEGEICFSEKDLGRLPKDFEDTLQKAAGKKGGTIKLSQHPFSISGGFVLVYGGVEENCSFEALFAARRDELSDKVSGLLFGKAQKESR